MLTMIGAPIARARVMSAMIAAPVAMIVSRRVQTATFATLVAKLVPCGPAAVGIDPIVDDVRQVGTLIG